MFLNLGLTGNNLLVYSIIYNFSRHEFTWTINYDFIFSLTGISVKEVDATLLYLKCRNLIEYVEGGMYCKTIDPEAGANSDR